MKHLNHSWMALLLGALLLNLAPESAAPQSKVYGALRTRVDSLIAAMPGESSSRKYVPPTGQDLAFWAQTVAAILDQHPAIADSLASLFGYHVVDFSDVSTAEQRNFTLLEETAGSERFWGTYIFAEQPLRPALMIQSPHPLNDSNTGKQGFAIFWNNGAFAFCLSGAHRCNHSAFTSCSGTTTTCSGSDEPYRVSDQAHVVDGMFQMTTQVLNNRIAGLTVVQPHGFAKQSGDPDLIMSNGTTLTPADDPLLRLRDRLLQIDPGLTFKIAHIDVGWTRLIATSNVQGRLLNGSANPCTQNATSAGGRFLHIEQAYAGLRDSVVNWNKLSAAVGLTFEPVSSAERVPGGEGFPSGALLLRNYPNPFNPATTIEYHLPNDSPVTLEIFNPVGQRLRTLVSEHQDAGTHQVFFDGETLPSGLYLAVLTTSAARISRPMLLVK